jgi:hypothetical protein
MRLYLEPTITLTVDEALVILDTLDGVLSLPDRTPEQGLIVANFRDVVLSHYPTGSHGAPRRPRRPAKTE